MVAAKLNIFPVNMRRLDTTPRRASKGQQEAFIKPDGLDLCLACWKDWMGRSDTDLGIKNQSTLRGDSHDSEVSAESSQLRRDNEIAEATDAMIRSLPRSHQWAIRRKCSVVRHDVWNFPQLDYVTEAQAACVELEKKLRNNVATRLLW